MEALAVVEVLGRRGEVVSRHRIQAFPAVIGRAYDADVILDDEFVAPHHLRIDASSDAGFHIGCLDERHGFSLPKRGRQRSASGEEIVAPGETIRFGHTQIRVWRPDSPVAPAISEKGVASRPRLESLLWVAAAFGSVAFYAWVDTAGPSRDGSISLALMVTAGFILGWGGIWWMCSRHQQHGDTFIAHAGVAACLISLAMLGDYAVNTLIFAFNIYSWPWSDLNDFVLWLTVSYCIYRHLRLISRKRRWVLGAMSALFVAALILPVRYTLSEYGRENVGEMQIPSSLRPPWMRVTAGVTPEEFVK